MAAYAGAVLLIHAARFLRETFGDSPVVIAKLNEPEPHFGIPAGVYDTVLVVGFDKPKDRGVSGPSVTFDKVRGLPATPAGWC